MESKRLRLSEILSKYRDAPGLCTHDEILEVEKFLLAYVEMRDVFRSAFFVDPTGRQLESKLSDIGFYKEHSRTNG